MVNPISALLPNQIVTVNVPNTGTGTLIVPVNPSRNGLLISNQSGNTLIFGPVGVTLSTTLVAGAFQLLTGASIFFGGVGTTSQATMIYIPWVWTAAMNAIAAAGATNIVTVLEW